VLIAAPILGLVLGLFAGGRIDNLISIRFRLLQVTFLGFFLRIGIEYAINHGNAPIDALRVPLYVAAFSLLLVGLWANREQPGLNLAFVGILLNAIPIVINSGHMPVWEPAFQAAGLTGSTDFGALHTLLSGTASAEFLLKAGPLGDIVPIPLPFYRNVASIGDVFLTVGLAFFLFASTVRTAMEVDEISAAAIQRRLSSISSRRSRADRAPAVALTTRGLGATTNLGGPAAYSFPAIPVAPPILERVRRHPYVRLALDGSFSALWTGQLISLIGDRVHQVALAFVVLYATGSEIALGAVFFISLLPNLLFGAIAGTLVDRWDHREVMIVSDLLRAGLVLLIPIAAVTNLILVYPMVFLVTTISVFFRPAKGAILPRLVPAEDLTTANSAMWIAETFADIGGYAVAGMFVALLGPQLPLAFWADAVTYVASAILIASIAVAPLQRVVEAGQGAGSRFLTELREGWHFLRNESAVFANTLQATVAQFMLGIFIALMPAYAAENVVGAPVASSAVYGFLEGGVGAGNLLGGFVIGLLGSRIRLGRMVIGGYVFTGACVAALALTGNFGAALTLTFGAGIGNLAFVIPSQTIVQTRTPPEMMGRLLGLRFTMVFGSMAIATGVGGIMGQRVGVPITLGIFGLLTVAAGLAGLLVPAVRDV
jgi:DHA3 family macrolide efflux protein-like MFS transporter